MRYEDLPERWKIKVKEYLQSKKIKSRTQFNAHDFDCGSKVIIRYDDGSKAEYNYAFVIVAPELNFEVGIFTEHCGYHLAWIDIYTQIYVNGKRLSAKKLCAEYEMKHKLTFKELAEIQEEALSKQPTPTIDEVRAQVIWLKNQNSKRKKKKKPENPE